MGMFIRKNADSALQAHLRDPFDSSLVSPSPYGGGAIGRAYSSSKRVAGWNDIIDLPAQYHSVSCTVQ
jgi:hypothetical protein